MSGKGDKIRTDVTSKAWGDFWDRVFGMEDDIPTREELTRIVQSRPDRPWLEEDYPPDIM